MEVQHTVSWKVLLVEDEVADQVAFKRWVSRQALPLECQIAISVADAQRHLEHEAYDVVISDYRLGDGTAFDVFLHAPHTPHIIVTGSGDESVAIAAVKAGTFDYVVKDVELGYLRALAFAAERAVRFGSAERRVRMLSAALTSIRDAVYVIDSDGKIAFANEAFRELYGHDSLAIVGQPYSLLWRDGFAIPDGDWGGEVVQLRSDGSEVSVALTQARIKEERGGIHGVVCVARDVTERRRMENELREANEALEKKRQALQELAVRDDLTGLFNRRELKRILRDELSRASRTGQPLAIALIDIDHFKLVNDRYGHPAGDSVLIALSNLLRGQLRVIDSVARLGGEELVLVLPSTIGSGAIAVAERLRDTISRSPFAVRDNTGAEASVAITVSTGIAVASAPDLDAEELMRRADHALYQAKAAGRDRVVLYS